MKFIIACLSLAVILAAANAQVRAPGSCPNVKVKTDLNLKKFIKRVWYQQEAYPYDKNASSSCVSMVISDDSNGMIASITLIDRGALSSTNKKVKYEDNKFQLLESGSNISPFIGNEWSVLDTDTFGYAILYSCQNKGKEHETVVTISTSKLVPEDGLIEKARAKLAEQKISVTELQKTPSNKNCPGHKR